MGSSKKKTYEFPSPPDKPSEKATPPQETIKEKPRVTLDQSRTAAPHEGLIVAAGVTLVILFLLLRDGATASTLAFPP